MTYQLRRLRLHGLTQRIPRSHRYSVTDLGFRFAFFHVRLHARILRPALADIATASSHVPGPLLKRFAKLEAALDKWLDAARRTAA